MRNKDIFKYIENRFQPVGRGMKPSLAILILIIGLLSCDSADPVLPLTPGLVSEIKRYDLDNNGNSSDIRMSFKVKDNLNVIEYRIMIMPSNQMNSIDEGMALSIPSVSYLRVEPQSFVVEHSFQRLSASLLDINGAQIQNDREYVIAVFVVGTGNHQLKGFSTPFILKDQGIYVGRYWIGERNWSCNGGPENSDRAEGENVVDLTATGNNYSGIVECFRCPTAGAPIPDPMNFSVVGTTIQNYIWNWASQLCGNIQNLPTVPCDHGDPCPLLELGEGIIIDELVLEFYITSEDCISACVGTKFIIRQG